MKQSLNEVLPKEYSVRFDGKSQLETQSFESAMHLFLTTTHNGKIEVVNNRTGKIEASSDGNARTT